MEVRLDFVTRDRHVRPQARIAEFAELAGTEIGGFVVDGDSAIVAMREDTSLQVVRADAVLGLRHLASSIFHAKRAVAEGRGRGKETRTDFLLYLTGERQVADAIRLAGVMGEDVDAIAVRFGPGRMLHRVARSKGWKRKDSLLRSWPSRFNLPLTGEEVEAALDLSLLPLERTALLDVQK